MGQFQESKSTTANDINLYDTSLAEDNSLRIAFHGLIQSLHALETKDFYSVRLNRIRYLSLEPETVIGLVEAIREEEKINGKRFTKEACVLVMNVFLKHCEATGVKPLSRAYRAFSGQHPLFPSGLTLQKQLGPRWSDVILNASEELHLWNSKGIK